MRIRGWIQKESIQNSKPKHTTACRDSQNKQCPLRTLRSVVIFAIQKGA